MEARSLEEFTVTGFTARTCNADELEPTTAKIAPLWQHFYQHAVPSLGEQSCVYGVYSNYESDAEGQYDISVGATELSADRLEGAKHVHIPAGQYLVFTAKGEMPKTVIGLWGEIWSYFGNSDCPHERAYTYDYERYLDEQSVEICIAINGF
ncbi:transcriptional regulator [Vibrio zhanjiangensis]|uniref:Transcriptional regulator n=2 Tax=Vibrio zhanjiangensis TaxID=1046128 RepID=A0ABQ6F465_9VIBR|nr:transcriptional regulator [Vibrio zhanjiangensis]